MAPKSDNPPLVVVVGETASGKSSLSLKIAAQYGGEIICADSRTIYKGMDIASAKPTASERKLIPHHLLDIVQPDEAFSAAQFKSAALKAIADISHRKHLPIMVGGSGLYVDAVLFDFEFSSAPDMEERLRLQTMGLDALHAELARKGIPLPENAKNPRHLVRAIETGGTSQKRGALRANTLVIGLAVDRDKLYERINHRVDNMFAQGLIEETKRLSAQYGWDAPALQAPGYDVLREYIEGHITQSEARRLFAQSHRKLAKRQRTWFKRNKSIHWISKQAEAVDLVTTFLNK